MDTTFTGPESKKLRVEEEKLMTYLSKVVEDVKNLDQEQARTLEQAVLGYKQAAGEVERKYYCDKLLTTLKYILTKYSEMMVPHTAELYMKLIIMGIEIVHFRIGDSIVIRCRCKNIDVLLDLEKLVASGELDELFSLIMSCLTNEPATASVTISQEQFKNCLESVTTDAG